MIIYKVENKLNGSIYIGKTIRLLEVRKQGHITESKNDNIKFHNALRKYGPESFSWSILFECLDKEELNKMEKFFIANYTATNNLYNLTKGGDGGNGRKGIPLSEEHKRKISEAQKGRTLSEEKKANLRIKNLGKKQSEETIKKRSESLKGHRPWNKGKPAWNKGIPMNEEMKKKLSEATKGKPWSEARRRAEDNKNLIKGTVYGT